MARIEEHAEDCYELIAGRYEEVHKFLDHYAERFPIHVFGEYHRSFLHNKYGLKIIRAQWGHLAFVAALIHMVRDYIEMPVRKWDQLDRHLGKTFLYFNNMDNFEPHLNPYIVQAWQGKSLVLISEEND
jgi:hypothetical protein